MPPERTIHIDIPEMRPELALAELVGRILEAALPVPKDGLEADRSVRLAAEAITPAGLVAALIDNFCGIGTEFEAIPSTVSIDGFRELADGWRVWGVVGLSYEVGDPGRIAHRLGEPHVRQDGNNWTISTQISIT